MTTRQTRRPRRTKRSKKTDATWFDMPLFTVTLILLVIGVVAVFEASVIQAYNQFGDQLYFAKRQLQWATMGFITMILVSLIPVSLIKKLAFPVFGVSFLLLILVIIPGIGKEIGGAQRWLDLGIITFQPAEISKVALIVYLAALFEKSARLKPFLGSLGVTAGLIMLQPDLGTTIIVSLVATTVFFLAGAKLKDLGAIVSSGLFLGSALILSSPYRRSRLLTFMDPDRDPLGASYHIKQIIISLGSGGVFGKGIGRSLQKYRYLPEATTDSIFAVIGEETGFLGSLLILGLFTFFAYRGLAIAHRLDDRFMKLVVIGVSMLIMSQAFLNISAMVALVPLTGITLPFISYGGTSLIISLASVGLLLNMSRYARKK